MAWLQEQLERTEIGTLSELAEITGINKGTLSKYFHGLQRPAIDVVGPLCSALKVSPESLLRALNALNE
ncbi:MAG: hypothetical protein RL670_393 [Actinomycetota bacterium]|jgi:transcriptional regulator with XRE-family HTH domain